MNYKPQRVFPVAHNYIMPVKPEELTVKRKGKVIKGETEQAIAEATKFRNFMKNIEKRVRRERRASGVHA